MVTNKIVVKVERTLCENLQGVLMPSIKKMFLTSSIEWEDMCISKNAKLTIEDKTVDKNLVFEHKLVFKSIQDRENDGRKYAYRITTAFGNQYLIGSESRPFPVCSTTVLLSSTATDDVQLQATVTWSTTHSAFLIASK